MEKREKGKVILDVQAGMFPLGVLGNRKIGRNDTYIGIDAEEENLKIAELHAQNAYFGKDLDMALINARGEQIPVRDGSVDEVLFRNVLGNPSSFDFSKIKTGDEEAFARYREGRETEIRQFAQEAKRVLKEGGKVVIVETTTPENVHPYTAFFTEDSDLQVIKFSNHPKELAEYVRGDVGMGVGEGSFILELEKKKKRRNKLN